MIRLTSFALAAAMLGSTPSAMACSCMGFQTAEAQLESADLAFEGQVINVAFEKDRRPFWQRMFGAPQSRRMITTFQVYQTFKGEPGSTVALIHLGADRGSMCGIDFKQTDPFVVLAYQSSDGTFGTSLCTQAQFSTSAFQDAAELAAPE